MEQKKITKRETAWIYLFCLVTAFVLLLICTKSSFLYPFNDWVDANCYFSVGKSMMNGKVLYRDIYDHKGPLLYTMHAFAYLISQDTFFGVYLFEVVSFSLFLLSVYYILRLYVGKTALPVLPVLGALLLSALSFSHGDSAEEFCLPMLSWSFYAMLDYFKNRYPERIGWRRLLIHGALAGCVLWIKFTMLGFHFAWMVALILIYASRKDWKGIIVDGLTFLGGMFLATVPWILYFGIKASLWDWIGGYIYNNVFVYTTDTQIQVLTTIKSIIRNTLITFLENWQYSLFIVLGVLWFWFGDRKPVMQKVGMGLMAVFTAMGIYWGAQAYYKYYGFILSVFAVLGLIPILQWLERSFVKKQKKAAVGIWMACLAASAVFAYFRSSNVYLLGYPKEEMVQYKFKEIIEETEDPTLLNYGFLDGGFYTVCNIVPTCKYFAKFNIPLEEINKSQEDLIRYGQVDYVVTRNFELDEKFDLYELVAEDSFWFEGEDWHYNLYRLRTSTEIRSLADNNVSILSDAGFSVDTQTVIIPGIQKEYHFVFVNDLHILIPNEEVKADSWDTVMDRYENGFMDSDGVKACLLWDEIIETINSLDIDGVLFGGDLIDYFSQANFSCFREGCEKLQVPFLYVRADHDYLDLYAENITQEIIEKAEKTIDGNSDILYMDCGEFGIIGINNSTSPVSDAGIKELERLLKLGQPVLLVTHVPFDSLVDSGLHEASKEAWQDRALLWGYEDTLYSEYSFTDNVKHMLDMVYSADTPIAAVFAGHLHFAYDGKLTEVLTQHVFDASFKGTVGYITVSAG